MSKIAAYTHELETTHQYRSRITIQAGALDRLDQTGMDGWRGRKLVIVSDANVWKIFGERVENQLKNEAAVVPLTLPAGESTKSEAQLSWLWNAFADHQVRRDSRVLALGGGVVGDLAGFAAATYLRGLSLVQLPTTLMAQVDSSIGGKSGINLAAGKNLAGAYWPAEQVLIDPGALASLNPREFNSGLAEVVKYAVIIGEVFFEFLETHVDSIKQRSVPILTQIVRICCDCKCKIVREDPLDTTGRRAILNYGHTFGHAIERAFDFSGYTHGQAVSMGMTFAARLACRLNRVDQGFCDRQQRLLEQFGLPTQWPTGHADSIRKFIQSDKKNLRGQTRWVLPHGLGRIQLESGVEAKVVDSILGD